MATPTDGGRTDGGARAPVPLRPARTAAVAGLAAAAVLLAAACVRTPPVDDPGAPPRGARAGVRLQFDARGSGVDGPRVDFELDDGRTRRAISSTAFSTELSGTPYSRWFETPGEGTLRVRAVLRDARGDTLAAGALALALRPDQEIGILAGVARRSLVARTPGIDPARFRDAWPLRGEETSADPVVLYLLSATRSISRPAPR